MCETKLKNKVFAMHPANNMALAIDTLDRLHAFCFLMQVLVELEAGRDSTATDLTGDAGIVGRFFRAGQSARLTASSCSPNRVFLTSFICLTLVPFGAAQVISSGKYDEQLLHDGVQGWIHGSREFLARHPRLFTEHGGQCCATAYVWVIWAGLKVVGASRGSRAKSSLDDLFFTLSFFWSGGGGRLTPPPSFLTCPCW